MVGTCKLPFAHLFAQLTPCALVVARHACNWKARLLKPQQLRTLTPHALTPCMRAVVRQHACNVFLPRPKAQATLVKVGPLR